MNQAGINPFQAIIAVAKIILFLLLPVISFAFMGVRIPLIGLSGYRLFNAGVALAYLPVAIYTFMLIASFGPMRRYSFILASAAIITELFFIFCPTVIMQQGDFRFLLSLIPKEYNIVTDIALTNLAKPGLAVILNVVLSAAYIGANAFMGYIGGGYSRKEDRANPTHGDQNPTNRNHPVL